MWQVTWYVNQISALIRGFPKLYVSRLSTQRLQRNTFLTRAKSTWLQAIPEIHSEQVGILEVDTVTLMSEQLERKRQRKLLVSIE